MYDRPFRWWVQSVMPLVFDDSLSYYEVLAKLTKYIEGLTGDVTQIEKILATIEGIEDVTQFTEMLENIQNEIGNLSNLSTQTKSNLVSAINEIALKADIAYWKPPTGIPESDLSPEVRDKLNKAASPTEFIINNNKLKPAPSNNTPAELGLGTYTVPAGGIPWDTLSDDVKDRINQGGSGGGTTDYSELNNKPQINGHTLNAGNNMAESLGLGTYSLPSYGIPESDLSAAVQKKLNTSGGIAGSQEGFVAVQDYDAGELVYINGTLYRVKYKILVGSNLVPGNNIEETDISSELEKINDDIDALQSGAGPDSWSLVANVVAQSATVPNRFFEYFNAISGEDYLFIITPDASATSSNRYQININKKDGTVVDTETVDISPESQQRFTFTPVDTGEYYCEIKKLFNTDPNTNVRVELQYTASQGITELWNQVNKASQVEPRVDALETLVSDQQDNIDKAVIEKGLLPANTDLNLFDDIGLYRIPSGDSVLPTLLNYPSENPGRLLVLTDENGYYCTQVVITSGNTIFTRVQTSASNHTWTNWASYDDTTFRRRPGVKNEDNKWDANLILTNGNYSFNSSNAAQAVNLPSPYPGQLIVFSVNSNKFQIYVNRFGTIYYRTQYYDEPFSEWIRPLKADTSLSISGAAADAKAVGDAISNVLSDTDNLFNSDIILPEYFDKNANSIVGTVNQLVGTVLVANLPDGGGLYSFEFDYMNTGGITNAAGPAIECDDENGNPLNVISATDGANRASIPLTNFKKFMHRSFIYYVPEAAKSFKFVKYSNPSNSAVFTFKNIKITKLPKSEWLSYSNYYPNKSSGDFIARNEVMLAGYVHDGSILRMSANPESIPVNEDHYGYLEFINATWNTLLPDGYTEGDYYNASTTKIHNVNVERVSRWMSTPYGENVDTYPIYRYMFTPQTGYNKTLFLTSGCHGNEAEGYWGLYRLIRMIYFESYKYPTLRNLKDCRLIIVPSWNPWGMQHYRRYNAFSALNTGGTDVAKNYQAWSWLMADDHKVTVNGVVYDIADVGEANVIWETLQEYGDSIDLWLDLHTDPYAGRNTTNVDIDDPRGNTPPYGCYGFSADKTRGYARLISVMDDFYNILKDEYSFTETWHPQATNTNGNSFTGWMAQFGFPGGVVEVSTFMNDFPYASGSPGMMKLAQEYYGNCIAEMLR